MQSLIVKLLVTWLVKNWKTTATGAIGFVLTKFFGPWLVAHGYDIAALQASIIMLIGVLAKDGDKTNAPDPAEFSSNVQQNTVVDEQIGGG